MRDLLLMAFVLGVTPLALFRPMIGVLLWVFFAIMNPHRETFGFAYDFSFNFWIALGTVGAWIISNESKTVFRDAVPVLLVTFLAFTGLTTFFAFDPTHSYEYFDRFLKTVALLMIIIAVVNTKVRIQALLWILTISIGYFVVKGAGFFAATAGQNLIMGPVDSLIADNNDYAVAVIITIPIIIYLYQFSSVLVTRMAIGAVLAMAIVNVIGTYSRGGLVGLLVIFGAFWMRLRFRVVTIVILALFVLQAPSLLPPDWAERMATIPAFLEDESFQGRRESWLVAFNIALDRPLIGGGFNATLIDDVFFDYNPLANTETETATAAHSIYFQILGDHGFAGLTLYLLILFFGWRNLSQVINLARGHVELEWARRLAQMIEVSMLGFLVSGALLSLAYLDLFLILVALSSCLRGVVRKALDTKDVVDTESLASWENVQPNPSPYGIKAEKPQKPE